MDPFLEEYECLCIKIQLIKEKIIIDGQEQWKGGFSIAGGIDQNQVNLNQNMIDYGIYIVKINENSPAAKSGLKEGDKLLQCNNYDLTMVTHKKALDYLKKDYILNLLVARRGVTY